MPSSPLSARNRRKRMNMRIGGRSHGDAIAPKIIPVITAAIMVSTLRERSPQAQCFPLQRACKKSMEEEVKTRNKSSAESRIAVHRATHTHTHTHTQLKQQIAAAPSLPSQHTSAKHRLAPSYLPSPSFAWSLNGRTVPLIPGIRHPIRLPKKTNAPMVR